MKLKLYRGILALSLASALQVFTYCEKPVEPDTILPQVAITSPTDGSTVSEVVTITCISTDSEGVEKVELWVDGVSTGLTDETESYSFQWNTTTYDDSTTHTITVRSYDLSNNQADSDPITLVVDNRSSVPHSVFITTVTFNDSGFSIKWAKSSDGDFSSYTLEHSQEYLMESSEEIYSSEDINDTTYFFTYSDPLVLHYFTVTVTDTFNYKTTSPVVSSSRDPLPNPVNVISVDYSLDTMTVIWNQSPDSDFHSYDLLYSETETGYTTVIHTTFTVLDTTFQLADFSHVHENWFWVKVTDRWGQFSIGTGLTHDNVIALWPGDIPGAKEIAEEETYSNGRIEHVHEPTLSVFLPPVDKANGTGIIVCPGGSYSLLMIDKEGYQVAEWLNSQGIAAFVLKYRLVDYGYPAPIQDARRAIRMVRNSAEELTVLPDRIGIMGFSAGGHIAATLGTHFNGDFPDPKEETLEHISTRPDFMVLLYAVISMEEGVTHQDSRENLLGLHPDSTLVESLSNERQVTSGTPPTFLVHAQGDHIVPVINSTLFYEALIEAGAPAKLLIYESNLHGFGLGVAESYYEVVSTWPDSCAVWMAGFGYLE